MDIGSKIREAREAKGLTQQELAKEVGISHPQIVRYETKGVQPPADVLGRIADTLDVSVDFLVNGNSTEKAQNTLKDTELLKQFKTVEKMDENDQKTIKSLIDAFITKGKLKQLAL
nr:helix-turn-helix transcriptional regulator [uncultured Draconibacterium sp.]